MNMSAMLIWIIVLCVVSVVVAEFELGYYWKDYTGGNMFKNALKLDKNSNVYVGQVFTKEYELLPAAVRTSPPYATTYAYFVTVTSNKNVKVLCSSIPDSFKWVPTHTSNYQSVPNLVVGGTEIGLIAYIGRRYVDGEAILGKIHSESFTYTINGGLMQFFHGNFEVLTYNKPQYNDCAAVCSSG